MNTMQLGSMGLCWLHHYFMVKSILFMCHYRLVDYRINVKEILQSIACKFGKFLIGRDELLISSYIFMVLITGLVF